MTVQQRDSKGRWLPSPTGPKRKKKTKSPVNSGQSCFSHRPHIAQKTFYCIVLDRSSSMNDIREATIKAFNNRIDSLKEQASRYNQDVYVSLLTFSTTVDAFTYRYVPLSQVAKLSYHNYNPHGDTALFDAVADAINDFKNMPVGPQDAFLLEVITDGEENRSRRWSGNTQNYMMVNKQDINGLFDTCRTEGRWTILFQLPPGKKKAFHRDFHIPLDCINEWEATDIGTQVAEEKTSMGFVNYMQARSVGTLKTETFYKALDLADLAKNKIVQNLDDLSYKFQVYDVAKENNIRDFTESKTKKTYIIGQTSYELIKEELVQPSKQVYVMEKGIGKGNIYGGSQARQLLGLPTNANVKIDPVNTASYRIFIESRSVNRILPRGTKVLIDGYSKKSQTPTWGS